MSSYFEHMAGPKVVKLDVIEFDQPVSEGIEVKEIRFDDTATFAAYVARETGRGP